MNEINEVHVKILTGKICPKCRTGTKLIPAKDFFDQLVSCDFMIVCQNFPNCKYYTHSLPNSTTPNGRLVSQNNMRARISAKERFNELTLIKRYMTKEEALKEISDHFAIPLLYSDASYLNTKNCNRVETWCIKKLQHFVYKETGNFTVPMTVRDGKRRKITVIKSTGPHTCIVEFDEDEKRMEINSDKIFFYKPKK